MKVTKGKKMTNQPSLIITPFTSDSGYPYVKVEIWAEAMGRYMEFDFQVCRPGETATGRAMRYLMENNHFDYWAKWTPEDSVRSEKMVADIMRDAAIYGHCD
jgi:hypothetical protein